jgi:hypothetical protein
MSFEILHFRGAEKILQEKGMEKEIQLTMEYLNDCLYGAFKKRELLRQALEEMAWRPNDDLNILSGRRYLYKGFRKRVAMDGSFSSYEYIQDALLRLQLGFDKGKIDMGIVLVTAQRSQKSPLGTTRDLVFQEIELLYPTISLPITVILFDLGVPGYYAALAEQAPEDAGKETPMTEAKGIENGDDKPDQNASNTDIPAVAPVNPDPKPDSASERDDFQEKMDRIEQKGITTSGLSHMKRWKKTRKKVKQELAQHELSDPLPAVSNM